MLPARRRSATRRLLAPLAALAMMACTPGATSSGEDGGENEAGDQPSVTVTIPPARLTPFCQAMIDLADRLENDPPDDIEAEIIETYEDIDDEVPAAIREDFDAVLARLRGEGGVVPDTADVPDPSGAPTTTFDPGPPVTDETGATLPPGDPYFEEGYDPDDDPALRLNAYIDFECRGVANNPGPPPTQPLSDVTTTEP